MICIFGEEKEEYITGILSKGPPDEGETENTFRPSRFIHIGPLKNWIIQGAHQLMKDSNDKVNQHSIQCQFWLCLDILILDTSSLLLEDP